MTQAELIYTQLREEIFSHYAKSNTPLSDVLIFRPYGYRGKDMVIIGVTEGTALKATYRSYYNSLSSSRFLKSVIFEFDGQIKTLQELKKQGMKQRELHSDKQLWE